MENIIAAAEAQVERKHFFIEYRENPRGQFLRITEEAHGRRNSVIVPSTGLADFMVAINQVLSIAATGSGSSSSSATSSPAESEPAAV